MPRPKHMSTRGQERDIDQVRYLKRTFDEDHSFARLAVARCPRARSSIDSCAIADRIGDMRISGEAQRQTCVAMY